MSPRKYTLEILNSIKWPQLSPTKFKKMVVEQWCKHCKKIEWKSKVNVSVDFRPGESRLTQEVPFCYRCFTPELMETWRIRRQIFKRGVNTASK